MLRAAAPCLALVLLLAGCSAPAQDGTSSSSPATGTASSAPATAAPTSASVPTAASSTGPQVLRVHGTVTDLAIHPLAGANVTLVERQLTVRTDAAGRFAFEGLPATFHTVRASAAGHLGQTLVARPGAEELRFTLDVDQATVQPYNRTLSFEGHLDCGLEVLIIPGSCDILLQEAGQEPVFANSTTFHFVTERDWRTIVLDVAFEVPTPRTFDGYHMTLRAPDASDGGGTYNQYGQFSGTQSFTVRLEPGQQHNDSTDGPLPGNVTAFKLDVYPMGYGYGQACRPDEPDTCLLGVGVGLNMDFQIVATVFYVEPAPAGFTVLP